MVIIWLRTDGELAERFARIQIGDLLCSTSDFFLIVVTALCGYRYGTVVFLAVFMAQGFIGETGVQGLSALFIYFVIGSLAEFFSESRWFSGFIKSVAAGFIFSVSLGVLWYITFRILYGSDNIFMGMNLIQLILSAMPESFMATVFLYLFYRFSTDRIKMNLGKGYLYTSDYEEKKETYVHRQSVLGRWVRWIVTLEATLLSLCAVVFFNITLSSLPQADIPKGTDRIILNVQLFIMILSVALPIAIVLNELLHRHVVDPINIMAKVMNSYFSETEKEREESLSEVEHFRVNGKNEIGNLFRSLKRMLKDLEDYIRTLHKEKELETRLQVSEARSQAQSAFFSNVSHEIRTPINAVLGMNEMILRESGEEDTLAYARDIESAGSTLLMLINDILDFSKLEAGKMELSPTEYRMEKLLNDLVILIKKRAEDKGLQFITKVDKKLPSKLYGDDLRIKQVITNILTNAVKYTKKGSVTLSISEVKREGDFVTLLIRVKDTGIGIREEDMDTLFSKYGRLDAEKNRGVEGTGLGMNITMDFLKLLGSELKVDSVYGEGSDFYFYLEQKIADTTELGEFSEKTGDTDRERKKGKSRYVAPEAEIFVVDDNEMNRKVFRSLLKRTQVSIDEAESGRECLEQIGKKKYDLIFLDHMMPEMDGIETLHRMKELSDSPNQDTPVFVLTANAVDGAKEMYLKEGFDGFITKPIASDVLEQTIWSHLPKEKIRESEETEKKSGEREGAQKRSEGLPSDLPVVDGLDWIYAWEHLPDRELLSTTLHDFFLAISSNAEKLDQIYAELPKEEAFHAYRIQVHAMKSSAATVGIIPLAGMANTLEYAARDGDTGVIDSMHGIFMAAWNSYQDKIKGVFGIGEESEMEKLPIEDFSIILARFEILKSALEDFDVDSADAQMAELLKYRYPEEAGEKLRRLQAAVVDLDVELTKELVGEILRIVQGDYSVL